MSTSSPTPVVGVVCNYTVEEERRSHRVGDRYLGALRAAGVLPLLLPALGACDEIGHLLDRLDGVMLTGGRSNIEPHRYGGADGGEDIPPDPLRDGMVLPLIRAVVGRGLPLFGICRGCQEINVAFGGSLFHRLHLVPGRLDHRRPREAPAEVQLGPRHEVELAPGGMLAGLAGGERLMVNSLHAQGIDRLAADLTVEAVADDGTIEAVRVAGAPGFALGVQWHPELAADTTPFYAAQFAAFGEAARAHAAAQGSHGRDRRVA